MWPIADNIGFNMEDGNQMSLQRSRTPYNSEQLKELQKEFDIDKYLCRSRRINISNKLELSEQQVKIWFQNRRKKCRKESRATSTTKKNPKNIRPSSTTPGSKSNESYSPSQVQVTSVQNEPLQFVDSSNNQEDNKVDYNSLNRQKLMLFPQYPPNYNRPENIGRTSCPTTSTGNMNSFNLQAPHMVHSMNYINGNYYYQHQFPNSFGTAATTYYNSNNGNNNYHFNQHYNYNASYLYNQNFSCMNNQLNSYNSSPNANLWYNPNSGIQNNNYNSS